jgi:hypothetical protein
MLLWRTDVLLGKDFATYNKTTAVTMHRGGKHASTTIVTVGNGVLNSVRAKVLLKKTARTT